MKSETLITQLKTLKKPFYTVANFILLTGQTPAVAKVALNRLVKNNKLRRLQKNIYVPKDALINYELIAEQLDIESYISFESALSKYGLLDQIPYALTLATVKRSKTITLGNQQITFRKIRKELAGGYILENGLRIATPEKALLDTLYLITRGKIKLSLKELNLSLINKTKFKQLLKKYPAQVKKLCNDFL